MCDMFLRGGAILATLTGFPLEISFIHDFNFCIVESVRESSPCFFDVSGPLRCLASDAPENYTSDAPEIRKSRFSEIRKSGNLKIRIFGFPEIRIFGSRISEIPENLDVSEVGLLKFRKTRTFGIPDIPIFRIFGKSENPKIR